MHLSGPALAHRRRSDIVSDAVAPGSIQVTGGGQPIVLLHPATGSGLIWAYQQPAFVKAGYRVIAYSRRGYISHTNYEFSSFLAFVEKRFGLPALTKRDQAANNMLDSFDFDQRPLPPLILRSRTCPHFTRTWWHLTHWAAKPQQIHVTQ